MSQFQIGIVRYGRNPHARCFEDVAKGLAHALRRLGHEVSYFEPGRKGRLIMFGANNMADPQGLLPEDAIVFNTEQVGAIADPRYFMGSFEQYKKHVIWDYSQVNAHALRKLGHERVVLCPIGYVPEMTTINNVAPGCEEIDVLFFGSVNERRRVVLDALDKTDLRVARPFNCYGVERDALIARSKIVLNVHHYERAVYEIFRVSHLLANGKCVVSEDNGRDPDLETFAQLATEYVSYEEIVEACQHLSWDTPARLEQAAVGHTAFKALDFVEHVRAALEQS